MTDKRKYPTGRPRGRPRKYPKVEPTAEPKVEVQKGRKEKLIIKLNMKAKIKDYPSLSAPAPPVTPPPRDYPSDGSVREFNYSRFQLEGNSYTGPFLGFHNAYNEDGEGTLKTLGDSFNGYQEGFSNDCTNTAPEWIATDTLPSYHYFHSFGQSDNTSTAHQTAYDSEATISAQPTPDFGDKKQNTRQVTANTKCNREAAVSTSERTEDACGNKSSTACDKIECNNEVQVSVQDTSAKETSEDMGVNDSGDKVILTADFHQIQESYQTECWDWLDPALRDPYPCVFCSMSYTDEASKNRHELVNHTGSYFQCPGCEITLLDAMTMYTHIHQEHPMYLSHDSFLQKVDRVKEKGLVQELQTYHFLEAERLEAEIRAFNEVLHGNSRLRAS